MEGEFGGIRQYRPFPRVQPRVSHLGHQVVNDVDASISKNELNSDCDVVASKFATESE